jgi:hypothetical protein
MFNMHSFSESLAVDDSGGNKRIPEPGTTVTPSSEFDKTCRLLESTALQA